MRKKRTYVSRLGPLTQKILLLLEAGVILGLTARPDAYFKVVKRAAREWQKINADSMHRAIKRLYTSRLASYRENKDGTVSLVLSDEGKQRLLRYHLHTMKIQKPTQWDGVWRMVLFDIPERFKGARHALLHKLKELGFYPLQKSVFIFPYECKNEIDFIIELFRVRPFVRFLIVKETDIDPHLKHTFDLK